MNTRIDIIDNIQVDLELKNGDYIQTNFEGTLSKIGIVHDGKIYYLNGGYDTIANIGPNNKSSYKKLLPGTSFKVTIGDNK